MITGFEIEFYEPHLRTEVKRGRLILSENGKYLIEMTGSWTDVFRIIDVIYAKAIDSGQLYTLVNCIFSNSKNSLHQFLVHEVYEGVHLTKIIEENCSKAIARMSGLTEWINQPRFKPEFSFTVFELGKVIIKEFYTREFEISNGCKLELCEFCNESFNRHRIILTNESFVSIKSGTPLSRLELQQQVFAFSKFLSIFTERIPRLTKLEYKLDDETDISCLHFREANTEDDNAPLLTMDFIEPHFQKMLTIFYGHRDKFVKVLDLLNASVQNKTAEISFLNITTAFEVFHKSFHEQNNETKRQQLMAELIQSGLLTFNTKKWIQVIRYYHLFKLVENIEFFKINFKNPLKTIELITESRNYYTHYSAPAKKTWSPNRLLYANKMLRQLLKGVLLHQMQFPADLITKLLNNRFATIFYHYEKNEYSQNFLKTDNNEDSGLTETDELDI